METTKEQFLEARSQLRKRVQDLSVRTNRWNKSYKNFQRGSITWDKMPRSEDATLDREASLQSSILCAALAHSRGRLHATGYHRKMRGHEIQISSLEDQQDFLTKRLDIQEKASGHYRGFSSELVAAVRLVAFSPKPERKSKTTQEVGEAAE